MVVAVRNVNGAVGSDAAPVRAIHTRTVRRPAVAVAAQLAARDGGDDARVASMRRMAWFSVSTTMMLSLASQRMALGAPQVADRAGPPSPL